MIALHDGYDGDRKYVSVAELAKAHNLKPGEYIAWPRVSDRQMLYADYTHIYPSKSKS